MAIITSQPNRIFSDIFVSTWGAILHFGGALYLRFGQFPRRHKESEMKKLLEWECPRHLSGVALKAYRALFVAQRGFFLMTGPDTRAKCCFRMLYGAI